MTISYTLDVSQTTVRSFFKLLFRWRGSVWKAVIPQLVIWTLVYLAISAVYRFAMNDYQQEIFANWVKYLDSDLSHYIPLSFLLGFFVSQVVSRWQHIIDGVVWIDTSAINFATLIRGDDEETCILRRTLIRYMVLNQALVLRDISMQVRSRFPCLESLIASGLTTVEELQEIHQIDDAYTRYWLPLNWCYALLYKAKEQKKICSDHILEFIIKEIQHFRQGLATLLKYDWTPIPLVYPQVVFLSVRVYFFICLFSRQHIVHNIHTEGKSYIDPYVPIKTMVEFFVYIGWMKVAEALLNPLGVDDDDIEVNYILDKNLITGFALVDHCGSRPPPPLKADKFYTGELNAPLYSVQSAKRDVYPLIGSASTLNMVKKNEKTITLLPHKNQLGVMTEEEQEANVQVVNVEEHNKRHSEESKARKAVNPDAVLNNVRNRIKKDKNGTVHTINIPVSSSRTFNNGSDQFRQPSPSPMHGHRFTAPQEREYYHDGFEPPRDYEDHRGNGNGGQFYNDREPRQRF